MVNSKTVIFQHPEETDKFSSRFAENLRSGDVILLNGDVGAGKSFFCRALIRSVLLFDEDIPSPTFTLVQQYETAIGELWHADLYRLSTSDEVVELGLFDAFEYAVVLIEWPNQIDGLSPNSALNVQISVTGETSRRFEFSWSDSKWAEKLACYE